MKAMCIIKKVLDEIEICEENRCFGSNMNSWTLWLDQHAMWLILGLSFVSLKFDACVLVVEPSLKNP